MNLIKENKIRIITVLLLFVSATCFFHSDSNAIMFQGVNFWKSLFSGRITSFYSEYGSDYTIVVLLIDAIAQIPLYILSLIVGNSILNSFGAHIYYKVFLFVLAYISAVYLKKIIAKLGDEKKADTAFNFYLSSSSLLISICVMGQVDIIGVLFVLMAYWYLFEKKEKLFLLFAILAVQCKYFPLFILMPAIIMKEKKLVQMFVKIAVAAVSIFLLNLPFSISNAKSVGGTVSSSEDVVAGNNLMNGYFSRMIEVKIQLFGESIPLMYLLFAIVCIVAYLYRPKNNKEEWFLYIGFVGILSLFVCYFPNPQRIIYILPFTTIITVMKSDENQKIYILESIMSICIAIMYVIQYAWCFDFRFMKGMLLEKIVPFRRIALVGVEHYAEIIKGEAFIDVWKLSIVFVFLILLCFLVYGFPNRKAIVKKEESINLKAICCARFIVGYIVVNVATVIWVFTIIKEILRHLF